jgi:hypothetical protein
LRFRAINTARWHPCNRHHSPPRMTCQNRRGGDRDHFPAQVPELRGNQHMHSTAKGQYWQRALTPIRCTISSARFSGRRLQLRVAVVVQSNPRSSFCFCHSSGMFAVRSSRHPVKASGWRPSTIAERISGASQLMRRNCCGRSPIGAPGARLPLKRRTDYPTTGASFPIERTPRSRD